MAVESEAGLLAALECHRRALAGLADDRHRPIAGQLADARPQLRQRDDRGAGERAQLAGQLVRVPDIEQLEVAAMERDPLGLDLGDAGVGLRLGFPRSSGGRIARIDLAFPLRDGPDGSRAFEIRATFAGGTLFNSHLRSETSSPEQANVSIGFDK